jgi:hypothetical protein
MTMELSEWEKDRDELAHDLVQRWEKLQAPNPLTFEGAKEIIDQVTKALGYRQEVRHLKVKHEEDN